MMRVPHQMGASNVAWLIICYLPILVALNGCISSQPYHVQTDPSRNDIPKRMTRTNQDSQQFQNKYPVVPIQRSQAGQPLTVNGKMQIRPKLRFIEFDEQGEFFDRRQLTAAINDIRINPSKEVVVVYIHGWQNRAIISGDLAAYGSSDGDVQRFKNFLVALANTRHLRDRRQVIGIYASWRGEYFGKLGGNTVTDIPMALPRALTYYGRRGAANRVGSSTAMGEMLIAIRGVARMEQGSIERPTTPPLSQRAVTIFMGHSFGARILEGAALQEFVRRSARFAASEGGASANEKEYSVPRFADLILFVNPADESLFAKRICEALTPDPVGKFPSTQPAIVSLCSTGDTATRIAMPLADRIPAAFMSYRGPDMKYLEQGEFGGLSQRDFSLYSAPNNKYLHNGDVAPAIDPNPRKAKPSPNFGQPQRNDLENAVNTIDYNLDVGSTSSGDRSFIDDKGQFYAISLNSSGPNRTQYWALRVDASIIKNHGDVWSPAAYGLYARLFRLAVPAATNRQEREPIPLKTKLTKTLPPVKKS
jgi:hypothetical protein